MTKEQFVENYIRAIDLVVWGLPDPNTKIIQELIGSIYEQQQMIGYLDNRLIDLERIVYNT